MARRSSQAIAAVPTAPEPMHGPREQNPRKRKRGRKGRRRHRNPKKNLGYGAKVGIAIASVVVVGGGGYLLYRKYHRGPSGLTAAEKTASSQLSQAWIDAHS